MPGKFLLDTNVIVYSFDDTAPQKRDIASKLIEQSLIYKQGYITTQVAQESIHALIAKFKHVVSFDDLCIYLSGVLEPLCRPLPPFSLFRQALLVHDRWKYGFYDALIIAGALALECDTLYSEDLQHGQRIENLTIVNPFIDNH